MKTLAIIAEYNPFHNGHLYQLNKAKEITKADYSVAIMSGNFLQRGELAMWSKYERAAMAIEGGIDLVIELPFVYATGSAGDFAYGALGTLNKLNVADYLCFGCENDNLDLYDRISDIVINEPAEYTESLKSSLKKGASYAKARTFAISEILKSSDTADILSKPNNILALEYIIALKKLNSPIKPVLIKRHIANYHDTDINNSISSATAIRKIINSDLNGICNEVPDRVYDLIRKTYKHTAPIFPEYAMPYIKQALFSLKSANEFIRLAADYERFCDISSDLSNKLNNTNLNTNYDNLIDRLSSKDSTRTRVQRALIHILMGYRESDRTLLLENGIAYYANVLGFRKSSSLLLRSINEASGIPLITKKADFMKRISAYDINAGIASTMLQYDLKATDIYNSIVYDNYGTSLPNDYSTVLPMI